MNKTSKVIAGVIICIILLSLFVSGHKKVSLGSVIQGSEYHATSTDSSWNSVPNKLIQSAPATLGQVVITGATAGTAFTIWDATSTSDTASTTIASFLSTATSGTYQFDVAFFRGLSVRMTSGNIASTTITYR